jgi:hypothetical protein
MREIKFRGKTSEDKWEYGGIVINPRGQYFITTFIGGNDVDPKTVGQYTGLHDKNGKEIYEGDILQADDPNDKLTFSVKWYECGGFNLLGINTPAFIIIGNIYEPPKQSA